MAMDVDLDRTNRFGGVEKWNMNYDYLKLLLKLMDSYCEHRFKEDYEQMFMCLDCMESILSAKFKTENIEQDIRWIEKNLSSHIISDYTGKPKRIHNASLFELKMKLNKTFKGLMTLMEKNQMLTHKELDVSHAMGQYE
jgi:hypothetical protein